MRSAGSAYGVELRFLGPFEVVSAGRVVEIGSPKQRALLAMLALQVNRVISADSVIEELWPVSPPPSATATLQSLVSRLRRTLSADRGGGVALRGREPGYLLDAQPDQIDVHRFENLAAWGRERLRGNDAEAAARGMRNALDLWRGPALCDLTEWGFARLEAHRLEELRLTVVEDLAEALLVSSRPADVLALLEPHLCVHPLRERAWALLMLALYRTGRQADALRAYQQLRRILVDELGIEPTPQLRELEARILRHDAELNRPAFLGETSQTAVTRRAPAESRRGGHGDTVALLFTDIEASTRRWEMAGDAMAADLSLHDKVIVEACEMYSGHVFSHTGDGLAAAFPTAAAAVAAAVAAQRALRGQAWAQAEPLPVRMAVHAGSVDSRAGNYFGPPLNRAARLLATASGGQIVCSLAAADLARDQLPDRIALLDLGEHRLADLARPERIFQVAHPELPRDFPPLRCVDAPRHNLPEELTSFIGREQELNQIDTLVAQTRLVTLAGVGGAGKTRLALRIAAKAGTRFPDGVWLVELAPLGDPALVLSQVVAAVGVVPCHAGAGHSLEDALCEHLRPRRVLIILDNCEHVVDAVAPLVHAVLQRCPEVVVLATSREVLGIPGEVVFRVPPLSLPSRDATHPDEVESSDAVTLFCDRARAGEPGFGLTGANASAVARICRRLDGIPLALELAAARIRILGAHEVAERLDDRFRLLAGGARTAVGRHQTLTAALDWSYHLLPSAEQALFRRLAVFPASFDLEAAEALEASGDGGTAPTGFGVLDLLSRLADKSLIVVSREQFGVRYRLLETVREYARQCLADAGESVTAHRRHRDHFLGLGRELHDRQWLPLSDEWAKRIAVDEDNFRAALAWSLDDDEEEAALELATSIWLYWFLAGRSEGVDWLERALAGPTQLPSAARVEAMIGLSILLDNSADPKPARSRRLVEDAFELAERLGDFPLHAKALAFLGERAMLRGDHHRAEQLLTAALERCHETDVEARGMCLYTLASVAVAAGELNLARSRLEQAVPLLKYSTLGTVHAVAALAPLVAASGDIDRAKRLVDEALLIVDRLDLPVVHALVLTRATEARIVAGDAAAARLALRQLLELLHDLGRRDFVADSLEMAALLLAEQGNRPEAAARLLGASEVLREIQAQPFGGTYALSPTVRASPARLLQALGPTGYEREKARGRKMTVEEAITESLAAMDNPPRPDTITARSTVPRTAHRE